MWLLTGKTLYFFTVLLSGSGSRPSATGLFEVADDKFKKDKKYRDYTEVTDEIWFFFDVETKDISTWDAHIKIIKKLRSLRKNLISELDF